MSRWPYSSVEPEHETDRDDDEPRDPPKCKFCGAEDLEWVDIGMNRWRLYDGKTMHNCRNKAASIDDFEEVK